MFQKRRWLAAAAMILGIALAAGCGAQTTDTEENTKIKVVCTIFPAYDWTRELIEGLEDQYDLTLLLDNGTDIHNYQLTVEDMSTISDCDLFVYVGGESDVWVADALAETKNPERRVINLMEVLGDSVKEEELVEGMEAEDEHDHEHEEDEEDEPEYDEHVWLSLKNAQLLSAEIAQQLMALDSTHTEQYQQNLESYTGELMALDRAYQELTQGAQHQTLVFGDRFPFRYLTDDCGLTYYAAFAGCSAETEASFETIIFLAEKLDELELNYICVIETSDQRLAQTVIENTAEGTQSILVLNSLQSVTKNQLEQGLTYLSVMQENLETLRIALNE